MNRRIRLILIVAFVLTVFFMFIAMFVNNGHVAGWEKGLFLWINHWPDALYIPMVGLQFLGVLLVPLVFTVGALLWTRYSLAVMFAMIIPLKITIEKIVKAYFERERPAKYIEETILRGDVQASGLSFFSGHAFIVSAVAVLMFPYLKGWWRVVSITLVLFCSLARIYLGAHLPLDVIAGILAGATTACLILLVKELVKILFSRRKVL